MPVRRPSFCCRGYGGRDFPATSLPLYGAVGSASGRRTLPKAPRVSCSRWRFPPAVLRSGPWTSLRIFHCARGTMRFSHVWTSSASLYALPRVLWGRGSCLHQRWHSCFLKLSCAPLDYHGWCCMTVTLGSRPTFGGRCGRCLGPGWRSAVPGTLSQTDRWSGRTVL